MEDEYTIWIAHLSRMAGENLTETCFFSIDHVTLEDVDRLECERFIKELHETAWKEEFSRDSD